MDVYSTLLFHLSQPPDAAAFRVGCASALRKEYARRKSIEDRERRYDGNAIASRYR
jgi:hypothetical protein